MTKNSTKNSQDIKLKNKKNPSNEKWESLNECGYDLTEHTGFLAKPLGKKI